MDPAFKKQLLAEIEKIRAEADATEAEAYALLRRIANSEGDATVYPPEPDEEKPGPRIIGINFQFAQEEWQKINSRPTRWNYFLCYKAKMHQHYKAYRDGNRAEAISAIVIHDAMAHDIPLPAWLSGFLAAGGAKVKLSLARTLDEAFGVPRKRVHIKAQLRRLRLAPRVYSECLRLIELRRPIDDGLFEEVGEKFGIGKTLAKKYFYAMRRLDPPPR